MNKKVNSAVAIAVIIIIAGVLGILIWLGGNKQNQEINQVSSPTVGKSKDKIIENIPAETPTKTAEWQIYQNRELGVEYKYPSDWVKGSDEKNLPQGWSNDPSMLYKKSTTQTYPDSKFPLDALISIDTMDNPNNLSLQEIFKNVYEECLNEEKRAEVAGEIGGMGCPGFPDVSKWEKIIVDGKSALRSGKEPVPEGLPTDSVYILLPKKFLIISATYYNDKYSTQLSNIFNEFVFNFKFIK